MSSNDGITGIKSQPKKFFRKATHTLTLTAVITALTCTGGFLQIKLPPPLVPVTFQTFFACLAGIVLGPKYGALSQLIYVALGIAGLPVFSNGGGIMYVFEPSFGFLLSFPVCAALTGLVKNKFKKVNFLSLIISSIAGLSAVYAIGLPYMAVILSLFTQYEALKIAAVTFGTLLYLAGDIATITIFALFLPALNKFIKLN